MNTYRVEFKGVTYVCAYDKESAQDAVLSNMLSAFDYDEAEAEAFEVGDEND